MTVLSLQRAKELPSVESTLLLLLLLLLHRRAPPTRKTAGSAPRVRAPVVSRSKRRPKLPPPIAFDD